MLTWRQVQGLNWQAAAVGLETLPREPPLYSQDCPPGMVRVRGLSLKALLPADLLGPKRSIVR